MRSREILFVLLFMISMAVSAQTDTLFIPSLEEVYRQNNWLAGANPVGLSFNRFRTFSVADASYSHHKGNFGNVSIPASKDVYSVFSESFQKMGKVSFYGKIGYTKYQNRQQNWNGMTGDYWQGVNLCDSISGKLRSEQYQLAGGFSLPVHSRWILGTKANYQVQLTAKDTDPRNKNQWMEWQLSPGVGYLYDNLRLGASLLYVRRKESVDYRNMGSHTSYPVLVAYPLGFFKTLSEGENVNWYYAGKELGGALQIEIERDFFQLYQDISGSITNQTIVSDRIKNKKEGETDSWKIEYKGILQKLRHDYRHEWKWLATFIYADNFDPLQHQVESGTWLSDGRLLRSTRRTSQYSLTYGYYRLRDAWHTRFSVISGITYHKAKTTLLFYPAEYSQSIHRYTIHTTFAQNFLLPDASLDLSIGCRYGKGGGSIMNEKDLSPNETAPEITLWQYHSRLQQVFEYETMPLWGLHSSITYTRSIPFRWYTQASFELEKTPEKMISTDSRKIIVHIGLLF